MKSRCCLLLHAHAVLPTPLADWWILCHNERPPEGQYASQLRCTLRRQRTFSTKVGINAASRSQHWRRPMTNALWQQGPGLYQTCFYHQSTGAYRVEPAPLCSIGAAQSGLDIATLLQQVARRDAVHNSLSTQCPSFYLLLHAAMLMVVIDGGSALRSSSTLNKSVRAKRVPGGAPALANTCIRMHTCIRCKCEVPTGLPLHVQKAAVVSAHLGCHAP